MVTARTPYGAVVRMLGTFGEDNESDPLAGRFVGKPARWWGWFGKTFGRFAEAKEFAWMCVRRGRGRFLSFSENVFMGNSMLDRMVRNADTP